MITMDNDYSDIWFTTFLDTIDDHQTEKEIKFLLEFLPKENYNKILDCACGPGRHAKKLLNLGYSVTGIDTNGKVISKAKIDNPSGTFIVLDMREISKLDDKYDSVLSMWQSIGNFSSEVNKDIFRQIFKILNENGRFIVDIYNRKFFDKYQGSREFEKEGMLIKSTNTIKGTRFSSEIVYVNKNVKETFEWEIYYDYEIIQLLNEIGFSLVCKCTLFDRNKLPSEDLPRMQLVFEKKNYE